jgi:hypothetical protein
LFITNIAALRAMFTFSDLASSAVCFAGTSRAARGSDPRSIGNLRDEGDLRGTCIEVRSTSTI